MKTICEFIKINVVAYGFKDKNITMNWSTSVEKQQIK